MRVYVEEPVPASTRTVLKKLICDSCKTEASRPAYEDWASSGWDVQETEIAFKSIIKHKEGQSYPGVQYGEQCSVDLCPECFKAKLIPFLESIGVTVEYKEYHY